MADLRKLIASMDQLNESTAKLQAKPVIAEGSMLKALNMVTKSVAPAAELAKEFKMFKEAATWAGHSDNVKNPNFNDELSGRRVSPPGKRLKSGKLDYNERTSQERTKALMKFKRAQGGLTGPKGPLPEDIDEGFWDQAMANVQKSRADRAGKPFEKNPASHDENGVYKGDKDLAGRIAKLPRGGYSDEAHPIQDEGIDSTVYPNAEVIKTKKGRAVGELYQDESGWGCFHYKADFGADGMDSRDQALDQLKEMEYDHNPRSRNVTGIKEDNAGEPSVDDILYYLTSAYRHLQPYADQYQDFSVITRVYENLRYDLKAGDYDAFQKTYENCLSRFPDASVELFDAMFVEAGLPEEQGTIEQFLEKCSGLSEATGAPRVKKPRMFRIDVPQGNRNLAKTAIAKLGMPIEEQGYTASSTLWSFAVYNSKFKTADQCRDALRIAMDDYDAWLRVENFAFTEGYDDEAHPIRDDGNEGRPGKARYPGTATEGIGDTIKRGVKSFKRGLDGWGEQYRGVDGFDDGSPPQPAAIVRRNKAYSDADVKNMRNTTPGAARIAATHSPAGLQQRVLDREMKKRGLEEGPANDRLKAHAGAMVKQLQQGQGMFGVFQRGGSIGDKEPHAIKTFADKEEALAMCKRYNNLLSPGEKAYYGMKYVVRNVPAEQVEEADKHSLIGKMQRGHELKKKVDSTFKDIGAAQQKGDHPEASKAFRKHERYANLERPGTWTKVKEAMPAAVATASQKMNPGAAAPAPVAGTSSPSAPGAPKAPAIPGSVKTVDPAVAKAQQAAYQKNIAKLGVKNINAAQTGVSMQKQADDMQLSPTDNTNNAKVASTLANVLQDPSGAQALKTLTDKYNKKPGQV
jgi:tetratricopeptide (TPR) repeat protein